MSRVRPQRRISNREVAPFYGVWGRRESPWKVALLLEATILVIVIYSYDDAQVHLTQSLSIFFARNASATRDHELDRSETSVYFHRVFHHCLYQGSPFTTKSYESCRFRPRYLCAHL